MMKAPLLAVLLSSLCAAPSAFGRTAEKGLTRIDAERRASLVTNPDYELSLTLDGDKAEFAGREVLRFTLAAPAKGLTVDFTGGTVSKLVVNNFAAVPAANGLFFELPKNFLHAGENVVTVEFSHPYSVEGAGLYRFKDPEDGKIYLYTNFEPYDANKLFPCFDQPDLKASIRVSVDAPKAWSVVSTSMEEKVSSSGARRLWTFAKTPKLSTYVFSVHAGPYHVWTSKAGDIPLRLFARESLAKYIPHDEWLEITRQGLGFYGEYFALPYPFKKYDQLIVPDFNEGAMENIGAVTFSERYVFRSTPTLEDREDMAGTVLHEMAHMWFGDLVTMKWWNGLWLNESFATYMASLSTGRATRFARSWQTFFSHEKLWAYDTDQRDTTHPIEGQVPDTEQAFANFDGITYGKGASVLKQLAFFLGEDKFRDGVRAYLKNHSYANAEEKDFFGAMSKSSGADLDAWTREWLETTGVNTVRADYACVKGLVSSFALVQTSGNGTLRSHRTAVALYEEAKDGSLAANNPVSVAYSGARTEVPALVGRSCPDLVYPNHGDQDFVKVELDAHSLEAVKTGMTKIGDPLARAMLWRTLWEMVRDAKWPVTEYADLVLSSLGAEKDFKVAQSVLTTLYGTHPWSPSVLNYLPKPDYPRFEAFFWENTLKSEPGGDFEKLWYDGYVGIAASEAGAAKVRGLLSGEALVKGMFIDQDRRWSLITKLGELGVPDAEALVAAEVKRDPSDLGVKSAITARAARPDLDGKRAWFGKIVDPETKSSLGDLRAAMAAFYPRTQRDQRARFVESFFKTLPDLIAKKDGDFLDEYTRAMLPVLCTQASTDAFADYLKKSPPSKPIVLRALRDARQEEERCVRIRALLGQKL
jgi:aminopeptidase N